MEKNKLKVSFTYKDGVLDGELGIFDGTNWGRKDIVIYLLKEMGYSDTWIANAFFGMTVESVKRTYSLMRGYRNDIYILKQKRAMHRLIKAVHK